MADYVRVGNRTMTASERANLTPQQVQEYKLQGERANQLRLDNMRLSGEVMPQKMTIDVTPKGVATRKAAIEVEEAKIAAETKAISEELGAETSAFTDEAEAPVEVKKSKAEKKKAKEPAVAST